MKKRLGALLLALLLLSSTAAFAAPAEDGLLISPAPESSVTAPAETPAPPAEEAPATVIFPSVLVPVPENETPSMEHFVPLLKYDGRFTDVTDADWFGGYIRTLYELGLTNGRSETLYDTEASLTVKEVLSFAARIHSLYRYGHAEAGPSQFSVEVPVGQEGLMWHLPYLNYLKAEGLVDNSFDAIVHNNATRAQAAYIMTLALPAEEFTERNTTVVSVGYATHSFITDVNDYTPYQQQILQLYKWGVLTGSDEKGSFFPDTAIKRSEFAALLTRLVIPEQRITLEWDVSAHYTAKNTGYADLVTAPGQFTRTHTPDNLAVIDSNIRYMLASGANTLTLQLDKSTVTEALVTSYLTAYLQTARRYVEQSYNAVSCSYNAGTGRVMLRFYSSIFSDSMFPTARSKTLEMAVAVHDQLWKDGVITFGMTQKEKALAYYTWVCENAVYDHRATDTSVSHTAYSLFSMGSAVCDGYTAAYNLLLKLEGISCTTASTEDHIWTVATLDGETLHIDPTWGDQTGSIRYEYFGMTEQEALARF